LMKITKIECLSGIVKAEVHGVLMCASLISPVRGWFSLFVLELCIAYAQF
jgi:hypothetical protein